jgi:hypothetical protein
MTGVSIAVTKRNGRFFLEGLRRALFSADCFALLRQFAG